MCLVWTHRFQNLNRGYLKSINLIMTYRQDIESGKVVKIDQNRSTNLPILRTLVITATEILSVYTNSRFCATRIITQEINLS